MRGDGCTVELRRDSFACGSELSSNVAYHNSDLNFTALLVEVIAALQSPAEIFVVFFDDFLLWFLR